MKQVTLNIPDSEFDFFMKLIQKFNYKTSETADFVIPEEVQKFVTARRKTAKVSDYLTREQSTEKIKKKYGF